MESYSYSGRHGTCERLPRHKRSYSLSHSSPQQIPGLFIPRILAVRVRRIETNPAPFSMNYQFRRDDVPDVFGDDVGGEEVEFSQPVRLAGAAGLRPTHIAT